MNCSQCGNDNRTGAKFCRTCGTKFALACSSCGTVNEPGAAYCDNCGSPIAAPSSSLVPSSKFQVPRQDSDLRTPNPELSPVSYTPPHLAERIRAEQAALEARGSH